MKDIITASYKQNRHEDDLNQPLSIQPWGQDSYKKKYYLVEGIDDTNFRVYKESNGFKERTWWSVAGNIDELVMLADKLSTVDGGQKARVLALKMRNAIPRFEATEEVCIKSHSSRHKSNVPLETQTPRISTNTKGTIQAT